MKFSFSSFSFLRNLNSVSLDSLLTVSWWVIAAVIMALLFVDGLVFYQYGFDQALMPEISSEAEDLRLDEEAIRAAADAVKERRGRFEAPETAPADLVNPFR